MIEDHRKKNEERKGLALMGISQELTWACI